MLLFMLGPGLSDAGDPYIPGLLEAVSETYTISCSISVILFHTVLSFIETLPISRSLWYIIVDLDVHASS
jgi:hypothetical protein